MKSSEEEQKERIKNCNFTFPDEESEDGHGKKITVTQLDLTYSEVSDSHDVANQRKRISSTSAEPAQLSDAAKKLIRGLIVPNGKKRLNIHKIKNHEFFAKIKWDQVEKVKLPMPKVHQRDPTSGMFEDVEPDSCDEDFEHEYEELVGRQSDSNSSIQFAHLKEEAN